jgi:hypothetical protein
VDGGKTYEDLQPNSVELDLGEGLNMLRATLAERARQRGRVPGLVRSGHE